VDPAQAQWRKATRSGPNGCVEVAVIRGNIAVRDSKHRQGSMLEFTPAEWQAFITGVRDGEFDLRMLRPQR
jgi:predicted carbohydrate-binding protein with CBM5 and CBM33 domain